MSKAPVEVVDFSDPANKRRVLDHVRQLEGLYEFSLKKRFLTRTLNQNSYYWSAIVNKFTYWLREEWGDNRIEPEQAHGLLKDQMLPKREMTGKGGEVITLPASTKNLDTKEFGEYVDNCAAFLAEFCGLVVQSPEAYYEPAPSKRSLKQDLGESIMIARRKKSA
jgi:hypothetical protein